MYAENSAFAVKFPNSLQAALSQEHLLRARLRWFVKLRWLAILGVALAVVVSRHILGIVDSSTSLYLTVAAMTLFNVWAKTALNRRNDYKGMLKHGYIQAGADLGFLTILLHFSGGLENPFVLCYVFQVVITAICLSARVSFLVAASAAALLSGMVLAEQTGIIEHHHLRCYPHHVFGGTPDPIASANGKPTHPLHVPVALGAISLTLLVVWFITKTIAGELRESRRHEVEEQARSAEILRHMADGVICLDGAGHVISCNPAGRRISACSKESGCSEQHCIRELSNGRPLSAMLHDLSRGQSDRLNWESHCGTRIVDNTLMMLPRVDGSAQGALWVLRDVTESRRLHEEAFRYEHLAIATEISAGVTHDLGNLVDGIINAVRILEKEADNPSECRKWAREILQHTSTVPRAIRGLLEFAKGWTFDKTIIDVNDVVRGSLDLTRFRAWSKNINVEFVPDPSAPHSRGDRLSLTMTLVNLILNACDAVKPGGRVSVRVQKAPRSKQVEVVVEDDGCGIRPSEMQKIFEPFYTTKPRGQGTGLGLTMARRTVEHHEGEIVVESVLGEGSRFTLRLPLCSVDSEIQECVDVR